MLECGGYPELRPVAPGFPPTRDLTRPDMQSMCATPDSETPPAPRDTFLLALLFCFGTCGCRASSVTFAKCRNNHHGRASMATTRGTSRDKSDGIKLRDLPQSGRRHHKTCIRLVTTSSRGVNFLLYWCPTCTVILVLGASKMRPRQTAAHRTWGLPSAS